MKEIKENMNNTYTIKMLDGWSITANATELEQMFNECYDKSILSYLSKI